MKQIKIDEQEEERINDAYARAAEEATGIKPMSEDPEYIGTLESEQAGQ